MKYLAITIWFTFVCITLALLAFSFHQVYREKPPKVARVVYIGEYFGIEKIEYANGEYSGLIVSPVISTTVYVNVPTIRKPRWRPQ